MDSHSNKTHEIRSLVAAPALVYVALFRASADCKTRVFNTHEGDYTLRTVERQVIYS